MHFNLSAALILLQLFNFYIKTLLNNITNIKSVGEQKVNKKFSGKKKKQKTKALDGLKIKMEEDRRVTHFAGWAGWRPLVWSSADEADVCTCSQSHIPVGSGNKI